MFNHKLWGFTLAETLITLVIIGVVASITLPSLWVNYQEKERIAKIKKMYSALSNAMKLVSVNGGSPDDLGVRDDNMQDLSVWFDEYIGNKLLHMKEACYNKKGCWAEKGVKMMNGGEHPYNNNFFLLVIFCINNPFYSKVIVKLYNGSLVATQATSTSKSNDSIELIINSTYSFETLLP